MSSRSLPSSSSCVTCFLWAVICYVYICCLLEIFTRLIGVSIQFISSLSGAPFSRRIGVFLLVVSQVTRYSARCSHCFGLLLVADGSLLVATFAVFACVLRLVSRLEAPSGAIQFTTLCPFWPLILLLSAGGWSTTCRATTSGSTIRGDIRRVPPHIQCSPN